MSLNSCRDCAAALDSHQRYCLSCGLLVDERRVEPLAGLNRVVPQKLAIADGYIEDSILTRPSLGDRVLALVKRRNRLIVGAVLTCACGAGIASGAAGGSPSDVPALIPGASSSVQVSASKVDADTDDSEPSKEQKETPDDSSSASSNEDTSEVDESSAAEVDSSSDDLAEETSSESEGEDSASVEPTTEESEDPKASLPAVKIEHVWHVAVQGPSATDAVAAIASRGVKLTGVSAQSGSALTNGLQLTAGVKPNASLDGSCLAATQVADCLLPPELPSIPAQLSSPQPVWNAYFDNLSLNGIAGAGYCDSPAGASGEVALTSARSPFAHLAQVQKDGLCNGVVQPLKQLEQDLNSNGKSNRYSYISLAGCAVTGEKPSTLGDQLSQTVDLVTKSSSYKESGLMIVSAIGPQAACGGQPSGSAGVEWNQKSVPTVVFSPWSANGKTSDQPYDILSLTKTSAVALSLIAPQESANPKIQVLGQEAIPANWVPGN